MQSNSAIYEKEADENKYLYFSKVNCIQKVATAAHFHDSIEIVLVTKGKCVICVNGNSILLFEGDAAFVDKFDVHYYRFFENSEHYVFLISEKYLNDSNGFNKKKLATFLPKNECYEKMRAVFKCIDSFWENGNEAFRIGAVNMVLGMLSKQYPLEEHEYRGDVKIVEKVLMYINEHFTEEITLSLLCERFGYSKNYFSALFNRFVGMNLREYVNRRRMAEFERLKLQNSNLPTYVLAERCGYESIKTFYRAHKKYIK